HSRHQQELKAWPRAYDDTSQTHLSAEEMPFARALAVVAPWETWRAERLLNLVTAKRLEHFSELEAQLARAATVVGFSGYGFVSRLNEIRYSNSWSSLSVAFLDGTVDRRLLTTTPLAYIFTTPYSVGPGASYESMT